MTRNNLPISLCIISISLIITQVLDDNLQFFLGFWTIYMENMPPMGSPPMGGRSPSELSLMNSEAAQPHPAQMQHLQQMQHQRHLNGPPGPPGGPLPGPPGPPGSVPNPNEPEISAIKLVKVNVLL